MQSKRGLSQVITTVIIIALIIAVIGAIWAVLNPFLRENAQAIEFNQLDLELTSATINYSSGIATLKVGRNVGEGNISGINVIAEDDLNSDIFYIETPNFKELTFRTIEVDLTTSQILVLQNIDKISIAPVYFRGDDPNPIVGGVLSSKGGLSDRDPFEEEPDEPYYCSVASDCGTDSWIDSPYCTSEDPKLVMQLKKTYSCVNEVCLNPTTSEEVNQTCLESEVCYNGACITNPETCTPETIEMDCGYNSWVGFPSCKADESETVIQDYRTYSCVNNLCEETTVSQDKEVCGVGEVCITGTCAEEVECTTNNDCEVGEVCKNIDGTTQCIAETALLTGNINSAWPPGLNEYFDSANLPRVQGDVNYAGATVIFPGSAQTECLKVLKYQLPPTTEDNAYIQLNAFETNISAGNYFEIWETSYACTL